MPCGFWFEVSQRAAVYGTFTTQSPMACPTGSMFPAGFSPYVESTAACASLCAIIGRACNSFSPVMSSARKRHKTVVPKQLHRSEAFNCERARPSWPLSVTGSMAAKYIDDDESYTFLEDDSTSNVPAVQTITFPTRCAGECTSSEETRYPH